MLLHFEATHLSGARRNALLVGRGPNDHSDSFEATLTLVPVQVLA
jgi:hypothetical protein